MIFSTVSPLCGDMCVVLFVCEGRRLLDDDKRKNLSMLSTRLCVPREGHMEAAFHVFVYLGLHHNVRVVFDPTYPSVDMVTFIKTDWKSKYGDVKEMIHSYDYVPHGKEVYLCLFVESDHAGDLSYI
jgi:hypothetical protein